LQSQRWLDLGNGVELLRHNPGWDSKKGPQENLSEIQSGDLLSIKITTPERFLVAVDTGAEAHNLAPEGSGVVVMPAQVNWVYAYPLVCTLQCICFEEKQKSWYHVELTLRYEAPFEPELKIKALLSPPPDFGVVTKGMEQALRQCVDGLNSSQTT